MSYDLEIRSDAAYSASVAIKDAANVIASQPGVKSRGPTAFVLDEPPARWMEIDLEGVDGRGEAIVAGSEVPVEVNCIRFRVPYLISQERHRDRGSVLPFVRRVAQQLGWDVFFDSTQLTKMPFV